LGFGPDPAAPGQTVLFYASRGLVRPGEVD